MTERSIWYLFLSDESGRNGVGEAAPLAGLSIDFESDFEAELQRICTILSPYTLEDFERDIYLIKKIIPDTLPSVRFALETALLDLRSEKKGVLFKNRFTDSELQMPVNGLVWMGDKPFMRKQIDEKLAEGYRCIKMKVGAIDFDAECSLLNDIRKKYPKSELELRVDANGAFNETDASYKLRELADYDLHSIEQPLPVSKKELMAELCRTSPVDVALDEQLIGVFKEEEKKALLNDLKPKYIVLKPTLLGGFAETKEWIQAAEALNTGWWITSALESNIGLNAIAQFTANFPIQTAQGLGTGQLYHNNAFAPLSIKAGMMSFKQDLPFGLPG